MTSTSSSKSLTASRPNVTPPRRRRCQDGIGEATSHNQTWPRRDVMQEDPVGRLHCLEHNSRTVLSTVSQISWFQHPAVTLWSCASAPTRLANTIIFGITHTKIANISTQCHNSYLQHYIHTKYLEKLSPLRTPSFCGRIQPWQAICHHVFPSLLVFKGDIVRLQR